MYLLIVALTFYRAHCEQGSEKQRLQCGVLIFQFIFLREQLVGKVAIVRYIVRSARDSLLSRADLTGYGVLSTVQVPCCFVS
jgi:hypothetical protein